MTFDLSQLHQAQLGIVPESAFAGLLDFSRTRGRYIISSRPADPDPVKYMAPWIPSLWLQPAGGKYIAGLWAGFTYITDNPDELFDLIIKFCRFDDGVSPDQTHIRITTENEKIFQSLDSNSSVHEIEFYSLSGKGKKKVQTTSESIHKYLESYPHHLTPDGWLEIYHEKITLTLRFPAAEEPSAAFPLEIAVKSREKKLFPAEMKQVLDDLGSQLQGRFIQN